MDIFERSATTADPQAACLDVDDGAFDAAWYLETYPDVGAAVSQGGLESALAHYLAHGREEGREARCRAPDAHSAPIVHLHIPKTAGTALRHALQKSGRRILEAGPDFSYRPETHGDIEVFSGHFGYRSAALVPNGRLITVLRDPVDRFISYYYHLIQLHDTGTEVSERTILAKQYGIDEFVYLLDQPFFIEDLFNSIVWRLAYGTSLHERLEFRRQESPTDDELLAVSKQNLSRFEAVGFQSDFCKFGACLESNLKVPFVFERHNVTENKMRRSDLRIRTLKKIHDWTYLDIELFRWAEVHFYSSARS